MWLKRVLITIIILLGGAGITLKLTEIQSIAAPEAREIDVLTTYMQTRDLIAVRQIPLNREGSFIAHIYRHKHCDGGWLISPMARNSEGVSLFARQAIYGRYDMGPVFYILQGEIYHSFPDGPLWLSQKITAAKQMLGLTSAAIPPVFAVRTYGHCDKGAAS